MNKVSAKILSDAENKVREIEEKAKEEEGNLNNEHKIEIETASSELERKLNHEYKVEINRLSALNKLEHRKDILQAKWDIIDTIKKYLIDSIKNDKELYLQFLEAMLRKGVMTGNEKIIVSEQDRTIFNSDFLKAINDKIKDDSNIPSDLKLHDKTRDTGGGMFLENGRVMFDATIESAVNKIFENHSVEITRILFPNGKGE